MTDADIRQGMPSVKLSRDAFERRYRVRRSRSEHLREPGAGLSDPNPK
ncbi:hypothetical protein [Bradyrhizobium canariense]|nr:hypothetical protein [Bradyrhizobium canariense]MBR0954387.1 hypothetical protein [Bradyrhizobium canariense]